MSDDYDDTYGEGPQEPPREIEPEPNPCSLAAHQTAHEVERLAAELKKARDEVGVAWEAHSQAVAQNDELRAALARVEARCEDAEDHRRWLTAFEIRDALKTLYTPHR